MTEPNRDREKTPPIDESTFAGSASETGGLYSNSGPTTANEGGDTMSEEEENDEGPPEAASS